MLPFPTPAGVAVIDRASFEDRTGHPRDRMMYNPISKRRSVDEASLGIPDGENPERSEFKPPRAQIR
jgi:hypothetical protein